MLLFTGTGPYVFGAFNLDVTILVLLVEFDFLVALSSICSMCEVSFI